MPAGDVERFEQRSVIFSTNSATPAVPRPSRRR